VLKSGNAWLNLWRSTMTRPAIEIITQSPDRRPCVSRVFHREMPASSVYTLTPTTPRVRPVLWGAHSVCRGARVHGWVWRWRGCVSLWDRGVPWERQSSAPTDMRTGCQRKNSSTKCREQAEMMSTASATSTTRQQSPSPHRAANCRLVSSLSAATPPPTTISLLASVKISRCPPLPRSYGRPQLWGVDPHLFPLFPQQTALSFCALFEETAQENKKIATNRRRPP
jgi:hypothetical protein